jgi:hypothetical protein
MRCRTANMVLFCGLFGFSVLFSEIPGLFYSVQVREPLTAAVCTHIAGDLSKTLMFAVSSDYIAPHFGENCIAVLVDSTHTLQINIGSDLKDNQLKVSVQEYKSFQRLRQPSDRARRTAGSMLAIVQQSYPDATVTQYRPKYGPFAP